MDLSIPKMISVLKRYVYADCMEGVSTNYVTRYSDLENLKFTVAFLANPFVVDLVKNRYPARKPILTQTSTIEAYLLDLQQDFALTSGHQSQSIVKFRKHQPTPK